MPCPTCRAASPAHRVHTGWCPLCNCYCGPADGVLTMETPAPADVAHARNTDPWTSHAAAATITPTKMRKTQAAVIAILKERGPSTDAEIAASYQTVQLLGAPPQSASGLRTRRAELVAAGLVVDTGTTRELPTGNRGKVWAAN